LATSRKMGFFECSAVSEILSLIWRIYFYCSIF
jgi:hypothetical protein